MSYQALYRKYRPIDFNDVVGQDVVVKTLVNALKNSKTSHAYMFSGPRGTGKTTIAKILAKTINCLDLKNGICCGKCKNCLSVSSNETTDIIEIDAASNNGVDEIREIRSKINLVPSELKYKVYIIDEVHMLSIGAFNALLKTLEEPPEHIVFILATTDPHKVPITIVSRCQCFEFKRIPIPQIVGRLNYVCEKEKIDIEEAVLEKIAKISEGGMRDALGILDKVSSYCSEKITMEDFNQVNGLVQKDYLEKFLLIVYQKDILQILQTIDELYDSGKDFVIFCQDLIELLRDKMSHYYVDHVEEFPITFILSLIEQLNRLLIHSKSVGNVKILFETSLLEFVGNVEENHQLANTEGPPVLVKTTEEKLLEKKETEENREVIPDSNDETKKKLPNDSNASLVQTPNPARNQSDVLVDDEYFSIIINNTFATAKKDLLMDVKSKISVLSDFVLDKSYGAVACYLIDSEIRAVGEGFMVITCNYDSVLERGISLLSTIESFIEKLTGKSYKVAIITTARWNEERSQFIRLKNTGEKYVLKDLPEVALKNDSNFLTKEDDSDSNFGQGTVKEAIAIFGEDIVKIK